jgi:beta-lactamase regulating signal transducer with metallopeptidase domain
MAKKDKIDDTPIEFYIPPTTTGRGPRLPIPINQPNWIYKYHTNLNSKPALSEWLGIRIILTIAIVLGALLIVFISPLDNLMLWVVVIAFGIFSIFLVRSAIIRTIKYSQEAEEEENNVSPRKLKKKLPKHRKDYK